MSKTKSPEQIKIEELEQALRIARGRADEMFNLKRIADAESKVLLEAIEIIAKAMAAK